jgi:hypothetical protein
VDLGFVVVVVVVAKRRNITQGNTQVSANFEILGTYANDPQYKKCSNSLLMLISYFNDD